MLRQRTISLSNLDLVQMLDVLMDHQDRSKVRRVLVSIKRFIGVFGAVNRDL